MRYHRNVTIWLCNPVTGTISGRERVGATRIKLRFRRYLRALCRTRRRGVQEPRHEPPTPASFLAHSLRSAYIAPFGRHSKSATFTPSLLQLLQLHTRPPTHAITPPDTQPCSSARKRSPTATPARSPPTTCPSTSTSTSPLPCIKFGCLTVSFPSLQLHAAHAKPADHAQLGRHARASAVEPLRRGWIAAARVPRRRIGRGLPPDARPSLATRARPAPSRTLRPRELRAVARLQPLGRLPLPTTRARPPSPPACPRVEPLRSLPLPAARLS